MIDMAPCRTALYLGKKHVSISFVYKIKCFYWDLRIILLSCLKNLNPCPVNVLMMEMRMNLQILRKCSESKFAPVVLLTTLSVVALLVAFACPASAQNSSFANHGARCRTGRTRKDFSPAGNPFFADYSFFGSRYRPDHDFLYSHYFGFPFLAPSHGHTANAPKPSFGQLSNFHDFCDHGSGF